MTKLRYAAFLISFAILGLALSPNAQADMWNKKTILTFSGPVRVANTTLPAGTYVFKLADTIDRHVVQIFNQDETHVYATVLANAASRLEPADNSVIKFAETASSGSSSGTLPAEGLPIKQWFYPGDTYGIEFPVRPAAVTETAEALPAPAPPVAAEEAAPAPEPTPSAEPPAQTAEAQPAPAPQPEPPAQEPAPSTDSSAQPSTPSSLPKTASPVPLIGLVGLLSLGAAAGLGLAARRQH